MKEEERSKEKQKKVSIFHVFVRSDEFVCDALD
jgi:hypothetical protein